MTPSSDRWYQLINYRSLFNPFRLESIFDFYLNLWRNMLLRIYFKYDSRVKDHETWHVLFHKIWISKEHLKFWTPIKDGLNLVWKNDRYIKWDVDAIQRDHTGCWFWLLQGTKGGHFLLQTGLSLSFSTLVV